MEVEGYKVFNHAFESRYRVERANPRYERRRCGTLRVHLVRCCQTGTILEEHVDTLGRLYDVEWRVALLIDYHGGQP